MVGPTNGQYNEHCLPLMDVRDLAVCTFFPPQLVPPARIAMYPGDGTIRGFFRAVRSAMDGGPYDIIHVHAPQSGALFPLSLLALGTFRAARRSLVYTVQDSFYDYSLRDQSLMIASMPAYKRVIFCSRAAYDSVPGIWKRLVRGRWRVVANGFDLDRVDAALAAAPLRHDDETFVVASVARLAKVKDPMTLLRSFVKGAPDGRLLVVGAGAMEPAVRERVADLGVDDRVEFTGLIPRDDVFRRCATADVFVSTSLGEGLPVAVMEAMASGCPVILSDIPPHRELADGADFIPFVPVGDVNGFAREIARFREMSPEERAEIGRRSRDHVVARFTLDTMHDAVASVYRDVLEDAGARRSAG
jgi:glycosyltransferase involved in cell wall biosynthesis